MISKKLISYLPDYYIGNETMELLQSILEFYANKLDEYLENSINQAFVKTADTDIGRWEKFLGIDTNNNISLDFRKEHIVAKLAISETSTLDMIKRISDLFVNGESEVIENNPESSFIIRFISNIGPPPNIEKLRDVIEELKPAHLAFEFEFKYNSNKVLNKKRHTDLKIFMHRSLRESEVV